MGPMVIVRIAFSWMLAGGVAWAATSPTSASASTAKPAKATASRDGWPDTKAGVVARQWVEAFSTGEAAMRAFIEQHQAAEGLAKRNVPKRIESYRKLRERYGSLMLASVEKATPAELTVRLMASDASVHTFVFTVQTAPPYKLVSVGIRQTGHGGFGH